MNRPIAARRVRYDAGTSSPELLAVERGQEEELADKAVIGSGRLEVDTVLVHLPRQLLDEQLPAVGRPCVLPEEESREHQPGRVGGEVVPVHLGALEMPGGVVAVEPERPQEAAAKAVVAPGLAAPRAPSSHDQERIRSAASIVTDQLTVPAYGFAAIHSSSTSRALSA